jgi:hypothetical protein
MDKLTIVLSGKKGSGKSSAGKMIFCEYANTLIGKNRFYVDNIGEEVFVFDSFNNNKVLNTDYPDEYTKNIFDTLSVKLYSFADPLKRLCIDVLGLDPIQCYGSDNDKNSNTHLLWDNLPKDIKKKYSRVRRGNGGYKPASGNMTAREVMQIVGTDVCRAMDENCWARGLYSTIKNDGYRLAIVTDGRFPNEITLGTEIGAKAIRLTRKVFEDEHPSEKALDNFPLGEFSFVVHNQDLTMPETHNILLGKVREWFGNYNIFNR